MCASTEVVKMCHWCQRFPEFLTTLWCSTTGIKFVPLFPPGRCVVMNRDQGYHLSIPIYSIGIQIRNMKMVFNFYCTWRRVTFEKFMIFFIRLSRLVTLYNIVQKSLRRWKIFYTILYGVTKPLSQIKKIIHFHH